MNPKINKVLTTVWNDPRAFFLSLLLLCLVPFAMALSTAYSQFRPTGDVQLVAFVAGLGSVLALVGFTLSWIPPIRRFLERLLRRRFFYLACMITLVALFYTVENWRGKRAWEKHRREWEAKGEKFDLVSLAPPPVPDEQNFAMTPLLKPGFDFSVTSWRDAALHLQSISATLPFKRGGKQELPMGNLTKGTLADLEACREFYSGNTNYPQPTKSGTAAEDILVALGKFDSEITELRAAEATRPYSRFPLMYEMQPPANILLPHLAYLKGLCFLVNVRTIAELESGRTMDAFTDLKLGFRLSDSVKSEPVLIDHLVRIAMLTTTLQSVREGLARHSWSDAQLVELEQYLNSINILAEYKHAIRGERVLNTGNLDYMRRQRLAPDGSQFGGDNGGGIPIGPVFPGGWFYQNMLTISQMHQEFTLACVDENKHRVLPDANHGLDSATMALQARRFHPYRIFAAMLFPALAHAVTKSGHMQTFVDEARVACGLERFRLVNGKFPGKLDALVPQFMDAIPNDVMDGQPLRYHTTPDGGYVIYSIGWNSTDDNGELAYSTGGKSVNNEEGDWVWTGPTK